MYIFLATILHTYYLTTTCCTVLLLISDPTCAHQKTHVLPEGDQELRPKHVATIIINNNVLQQFAIKYYVWCTRCLCAQKNAARM